MKNNRNQRSKDIRLEAFLAGYKEESISETFKQKIIKEAIRETSSYMILSIKPAWKRLSLVASVAAFALGIVLSNQVFSNEQISNGSDWNFGDQGLYSYLMEDER